MLGYAVRDFYLNGGSTAVIVRLFHPNDSRIEAIKVAADEVVEAINASTATNPADIARDGRTKATAINGDDTRSQDEKDAANAVAKAGEDVASLTGADKAAILKAAEDAAASAVLITKTQLTVGGYRSKPPTEAVGGTRSPSLLILVSLLT